MNTKRLLSLLLALTMVFTLFACGNDDFVEDDDEDEEDEETVETSEDTTEDTGETTEATGEPEVTQPETTAPVPTEPEPTEPEPTEPEVVDPEPETQTSLGRWNGSTYINEYAGYQITFDSDWTLYSVTDLQSTIDDVQDLFSDSALGSVMENMTQLFDMKAESVADLATVNVVYTKRSDAEKQLMTAMTEEQIVDYTLLSKDLLIQTYADVGMTVSSMEKISFRFADATHYGIKTVGDINGMTLYYLQIFHAVPGDWSVVTTISCYITDTTETIAAMTEAA